MSTKRALFLGGLLTVPAVLQLGACEKYNTCENTLSCEEYGSGGDSSSGGGDGDDGGTGGMLGGNGGQGGDMQDPCAACEGDTPACTAEKECVECTMNDTEACTGTTDLCDDEKNECVECLGHTDCDDATKPICDGGTCVACDGNESCGEIGNYCLGGGECVECLSEDDCGGDVCDPNTNSCTDIPAGSTSACGACEYDAQCEEGQVCVPMTWDDPTPDTAIGNFCLWVKSTPIVDGGPGGVCGTFRPFAATLNATSVNGQTVETCAPRTTTCPALLQHAAADAGCQTAVVDDDACGVVGQMDGLCRLDGDSMPLCTYPCIGTDDRDCPLGTSCIDDGVKYCGI